MNTELKNKVALYTKLHSIQKRIKGLGKDAKGYGYSYVSGNKILSLVRDAMDELGILLKQEVLNIENTRQDYTSKTGPKSEILSNVSMRFTWIDVETGEEDVNFFAANGFNGWEQGLGSALTYAERYFFLKFFHIATDEDDVDNPYRKNEEMITSHPKPTPTPEKVIEAMRKCKTIEELTAKYKKAQGFPELKDRKEITGVYELLSKQL